MWTALRLCISVGLTGIVLLGQAKPKDVYGWGKIRWGMTVAQAKSAYGTQTEDSDGKDGNSTKFKERLTIKSFAVGDVKMKVSIETLPSSNLVKEVSLSMAGEPQSSDVAAIRKHSDSSVSAYSYLKESLTQKYGRPTSQDKDQDGSTETSSVMWTFPSTVIRLYLIEVKNIGYAILGLQYTATDKKALDVL